MKIALYTKLANLLNDRNYNKHFQSSVNLNSPPPPTMCLAPIMGGRVACVRAALALSAVSCPHCYPIPQHTPSLMTHATNDTPHYNSDDDFSDFYDFPTFPTFPTFKTRVGYQARLVVISMVRFKVEGSGCRGADNSPQRIARAARDANVKRSVACAAHAQDLRYC